MDFDVGQLLTIPLFLIFAFNEFYVEGTVLVKTPTPDVASIGKGSFNLDCIISTTDNEQITQVTWLSKKKYSRYYKVVVQVPISIDGSKEALFRNTRLKARSEVSVRPGNNGRTHVRLKVSNATCDDEGSYKCRVDVFGGEAPDHKVVNVSLTVAPKVFSIRHKFGSLIENQMVTFECSASMGKPPGKLMWTIEKLEGGRLKSYPVSGRIEERVGNDDCSPLAVGTIEHAVTGDDEAIKCMIVRETHEFTLEKLINVVFAVRNTKIATTVNGDLFAHWMRTIDVKEGDDVVFTCSARGHPQPEYRWRHVMHEGRDSGDWIKTDNGSLILGDVSKNYSGTYMCTSANVVSGRKHTTEKKIKLLIKDKPTRPSTTTTLAPGGETKGNIMPIIAGVGIVLGLIVSTLCGKCCGG